MAIDELTYPQPNTNRAAAGAVVTAEGVPVPPAPRTRIVDFFIVVGANQRTSRSAARMRGPAIIQSARYDFDNVAGNDGAFFEVGYNALPVEEQLVSTSTPWTWPTASERMPQQGGDFNANVRGYTNTPAITQKIQHERDLRVVVTLPEFFLVMTVGQIGGAAGFTCRGYVVVIEGVNPAALANFL